ncbi:MAG: PRC-barrel domain-containing protein, partial [Egibacteraceae bacterium]
MDDFEVSDGEPDPRGWEVHAMDGRRIGEVEDMLVDRTAMKVRYLDVEVDEKGLGIDEEKRHLLVPVEYARLDEVKRNVLVDRLQSARVAEMRGRYDLRTAGLEVPAPRGDAPRPHDTAPAAKAGETHITRSEEELAVGKRERKA